MYRLRKQLYQANLVYVRTKEITDGIYDKPIETMEDMMNDADDLNESSAMAVNPTYLSEFDLANANLGMTHKIPPMYDGRTSWFQYEELIDDWVDLTNLADDKRGPALKARLIGEAAVYKPFLELDKLRQLGGVDYFNVTMLSLIHI